MLAARLAIILVALAVTARASPAHFLHLVNGRPALRPLLGIDFARNDFFDFSFGARAVLWRGIMVFANGIYALNDAGLRNDTVIPTAGFEGTF